MKSRQARILSFAIIPVASWGASVAQPLPAPSRIEVFLSARAQVETRAADLEVPVTVYDLDAPAREEARFSQGLPADRDQAMAEAKRRLADISQSEQDRINSAFDGLLKALQYGLDRYPAIVFDDGQAVVYGTGLEEALGHYRKWRARQAQQR
jgi:integrating conjugative element protein (TIGR03757 family)